MSSTQREEALFLEATGLPDEERAAFLAVSCGDDAALRQRVAALLREHAEETGALDRLPSGVSAELKHVLQARAPVEDQVGARIGVYKLLEKLGEGGCGVVFMALQEAPMRRRVALKLIKPGMDTKEVLGRFESERQALAMMDHPHIARVLDAGTAETGRPYFVMELVRGTPITRHCDEHNLGMVERLDLFVQVCRAIQHAHQKGIIHRDLKPTNILVNFHDGVAVPKVIDFGIAKAMSGSLTDRTLRTAFEQLIGTPAYMSPEQTEISGLDVDTRSDIYSLGVLLYELLTGRTPFPAHELLSSGLEAMRRTIREKDPPRPSACVGAFDAATRLVVARQHGVDAPQLRSLLRGDLDWIVMRCLEKDRSRRYETADALAMDLGRYLRSEPIVARPPSALYNFRKLVYRNRLAVVAGSAVLASLVGGLLFSTWTLQREKVARTQAQTAATSSAQVARFMQEAFAGVGPQVALGRDTALLRALLDEAVERMGRELKGQPVVEADLRETLGNVYRDIGEYSSGTMMHETALRMREQVFGPEHAAVASSLGHLAELMLRQKRFADAEAMLRRALVMQEKLLGAESPVTKATRAALAYTLLRAAQFQGVRVNPGALPSAMPAGRQPAVIRLARSGGRASGQPHSGGDVLLTAREREVFQAEFAADGIRIDWRVYSSGLETNKAFSRGEVDFAQQGSVLALVGRETGLRHRVLLALNRFGSALHLVVRADSAFQSVADLRGRRLATMEGTTHQLALYSLLRRHGFSEGDFEIVRRDSAVAILNALVAGEIDGHLMNMPFDLEMARRVRILESVEPRRDAGSVHVFWVSEEFEQRYPATVQRVVHALIRTAAWNSDEANRMAVFELWARPDRSTAALAKKWAGVVLKERLSPLLDDYFAAALRRNLADARLLGGRGGIDGLSGWVEPKYLQAALVELRLQHYWPEFDAEGQPKQP